MKVEREEKLVRLVVKLTLSSLHSHVNTLKTWTIFQIMILKHNQIFDGSSFEIWEVHHQIFFIVK